MRVTGLLFLLLILLAVIGSNPAMDVGLLMTHAAPARMATFQSNGNGWHYSDSSPFHAIVSENAREFQSRKPVEVAAMVCGDLGGEIEHIESPRASDAAIGFLCRFTEPDVTMSVDFGDLSRIPSN
ncbi:MAG TPA: hypothetical protein VF267_12810 [Gammaproteobacteria bacterium]